jgi:hypothetical protein
MAAKDFYATGCDGSSVFIISGLGNKLRRDARLTAKTGFGQDWLWSDLPNRTVSTIFQLDS